MAKQKKLDAITRRDVDFAQWDTDVFRKAELMDSSSIKGFSIYRPYGYAIWERIQNYLDQRFKETGHENVYMPMLIPESLLQKEADHVEGFAPECAVVTRGGLNELEEKLVIRPTSETLFCEHYAKVVNSYRDLPKNCLLYTSEGELDIYLLPFFKRSDLRGLLGVDEHLSMAELFHLYMDCLLYTSGLQRTVLNIL